VKRKDLGADECLRKVYCIYLEINNPSYKPTSQMIPKNIDVNEKLVVVQSKKNASDNTKIFTGSQNLASSRL
jgi:hypothetical protein